MNHPYRIDTLVFLERLRISHVSAAICRLGRVEPIWSFITSQGIHTELILLRQCPHYNLVRSLISSTLGVSGRIEQTIYQQVDVEQGNVAEWTQNIASEHES